MWRLHLHSPHFTVINSSGGFCLLVPAASSLPVPGPQFCQEILVALLDFTQLKMSLQPENQQFCHSDQKRKDGELCS